MTAETYERMATGGPLVGGPNTVKLDLGIWIEVPKFHANDAIWKFNIAEVLPTNCVGRSVMILEVGLEEEIFCFIRERAKDLKGVSSQ